MTLFKNQKLRHQQNYFEKKPLKLRLLGLIFKHCDIIALPSFLKCF